MAMKLPGVRITTQDGGLARTGGSIGAIALIGTGTKDLKNVISIVSGADAEKFGDGSLQRAAKRILAMSGVELVGYALADGASSVDYMVGVDALMADQATKECIAIVDTTDKAAWATFAQKLQDAALQQHKYMYGVAQTRAKGDNETDTAYASALVGVGERGNVESERLVLCAGSVPVTGRDGVASDAPLIDTVLGLIAGREPHEGIDAVKYGALVNVTKLSHAFSDAELTALLNAGYVTARHYYGRPGVYITLARLATADTSDYDVLTKIRVVNRASMVVRNVQLEFVNDTIPANDGGAALIKKASEQPLEQMKANGEITDFAVAADISKLISDRQISTQVQLVPLGTASVIETTIVYTREV